jgi:hypothetical protein
MTRGMMAVGALGAVLAAEAAGMVIRVDADPDQWARQTAERRKRAAEQEAMRRAAYAAQLAAEAELTRPTREAADAKRARKAAKRLRDAARNRL